MTPWVYLNYCQHQTPGLKLMMTSAAAGFDCLPKSSRTGDEPSDDINLGGTASHSVRVDGEKMHGHIAHAPNSVPQPSISKRVLARRAEFAADHYLIANPETLSQYQRCEKCSQLSRHRIPSSLSIFIALSQP